MEKYYILFSIPILGLIAYQDLRHFSCSLFLFPLLFILNMILGYISFKANVIPIVLTNIAITVVIFAFIFIYVFIKEKKLVNIFENHIGLGDLLFILCLCPIFESVVFIVFINLSLILILIIWGIIALVKANRTKVPLAGLMSISYIFYVLLLASSYFDPMDIIKKIIFYGS